MGSSLEPVRKAFQSPIVIGGLILIVIGGAYRFWPVGSESGRVAVQGTLSVDGDPISEGIISFLPASRTKGPSSSGRIENGMFHIDPDMGPGVGEYRLIVQVGNLYGASPAPSDQASPSTQTIAGQRFERSVSTQSSGENHFSFDFSASEVDNQIQTGRGPNINPSIGRSAKP